jgi:hypothetical protein
LGEQADAGERMSKFLSPEVASLLTQWQTSQKEWFNNTILEIVGEYAEWCQARHNKAIKTVQNAARSIIAAEGATLKILQEKNRKDYIAERSLDSEREANYILTEENEILKNRIAELEGILNESGKNPS